MSNINESKFSSIEFHDNGVAIGLKMGPTTTQNIYIKNDDMKKLIKKFVGSVPAVISDAKSSVTANDNSYATYMANKSSESGNGIEDAVY